MVEEATIASSDSKKWGSFSQKHKKPKKRLGGEKFADQEQDGILKNETPITRNEDGTTGSAFHEDYAAVLENGKSQKETKRKRRKRKSNDGVTDYHQEDDDRGKSKKSRKDKFVERTTGDSKDLNKTIASTCTDSTANLGNLRVVEGCNSEKASVTKNKKVLAPTGSLSRGKVIDSDNDEEDEDELIAAAAAWAHRTEEEEEKAARINTRKNESELQHNFSLHITQLPYDANDFDIRRLLAEQGCAISSIRLVYDKDENGRKSVFRGVAFVDFVDSESYERALKMNRKLTVRGRKINIRPTRSKKELADIVSRTQEFVQGEIRKQLELGKKEGESGNNEKKRRKKGMDKMPDVKKKAAIKSDSSPKKKRKEKSKVMRGSEGKYQTNGASELERKLSKKERNRRAAIILARAKKNRK